MNNENKYDETLLYIEAAAHALNPSHICECEENEDEVGGVITPNFNGHDYVDLGLPSGTLWATTNIGATTPEAYGDYFAWGETTTKTNYDWSTYKYGKSYNSLTKYCNSSSYGTVDNKLTLEPEDDAAHVNWGGDWRMPTAAEQAELLQHCNWSWTSVNGVNGYRVTSKSNDNSIFLPCAGRRSGASLSNAGSGGSYWSSSLRESNADSGQYLYFDLSNRSQYNYNRYYGFSVRPVISSTKN